MKGINALELLKDTRKFRHEKEENLVLIDIDYFNRCLNIIEKELKALEIIKETPEFAWYVIIYKNVYEMIIDRKSFRIYESTEELKEKFNLLKEVIK